MENYHVIDLIGEGSFGKVQTAQLLLSSQLHLGLLSAHQQAHSKLPQQLYEVSL